MRFTYRPDIGFGSGWLLQIGWLRIDWDRYEDHWALGVMWAKPLR
jgi:hypothetical protein